MAARIVRPVFALLVLGLAVHAVNAAAGPDTAPANETIVSWVYTGVMPPPCAAASVARGR